MAPFFKKGFARIARWLPIVCLTALPRIARCSDTAEIKSGLSNLIMQVEVLQIQTGNLRTSLNVITNSVRKELTSVQNGLENLRTAVESKATTGDASAGAQIQFAMALRDLSNSVSALNGLVADWKAVAEKSDSKGEAQRELAALNARVAGLTNALLNLKPVGMDTETRENFAFVKNSLSRANAPPVWMNYTFLGLLVVLLGLSGWLITSVQGQLASSDKRTRESREILTRLGTQMDGRVKSMEGSSVAVQNSAREINDFLGRVESAVSAQLERVSQQLNSAQVAELAGGAARAAEQMSRLRSETADLQRFLGDVHDSTQRRISDFEKQTGQTLEQIKVNMYALEDLLWPAPFRDGGKLGDARESIRIRATAGDTSAFALLLGLGHLQLALDSRDGDMTPLIEALDQLGVLAYRFWKGELHPSVESTFEQAQAWAAEINKLLSDNNVPLSIRVIMPRAGFDMGTMLSEHSATGTTTRVREPLSWAVVDKVSEHHSKVLITGKVITE